MERKKVVIIGSSFAGLSCAKALADSEFEVLILEKDNVFGIKTCASGVKDQDLAYITQNEVNFPFEPVYLCTDTEKIQMPWGRGMISSIVRSEVLTNWAKKLADVPNIKIRLNSKVSEIKSNTVNIVDGEAIEFDYLIGADGSNSIVRRFLNLPQTKYLPAVQYIIPEKIISHFEIYADTELFDKGYSWIFPNRDFTSVGACVMADSPNARHLRGNLDAWLKKMKIDISRAKYEGFLINYDFQGYKFDNIYLAGDAGGFANGLTGKGIYGAALSGEVIAEDILGRKDHQNSLQLWMKEKAEDEAELKLDGNFVLRKIQKIKAYMNSNSSNA